MADTSNKPLEFTYTIPNLAKFVAALQSSPEIVTPILQRTLAASQAILAKHTGQNVPYKTGFLRGSFQYMQEALTARWFPTASYALFVEQGTGIYGPTHARIVPKSKMALYWPGADHPVKSVAGMQPREYMEKILDQSTSELTDLFAHSLDLVNQAIANQATT